MITISKRTNRFGIMMADSDIPMLWINGLDDRMIPVEPMLNNIMKQAEEAGISTTSRIDMETDHMASDRRCQFTEVTADWLISQCS